MLSNRVSDGSDTFVANRIGAEVQHHYFSPGTSPTPGCEVARTIVGENVVAETDSLQEARVAHCRRKSAGGIATYALAGDNEIMSVSRRREPLRHT